MLLRMLKHHRFTSYTLTFYKRATVTPGTMILLQVDIHESPPGNSGGPAFVLLTSV